MEWHNLETANEKQATQDIYRTVMLCIMTAAAADVGVVYCSGGCGRGINVLAAGRPVWGVAGFSFALVSR